MRSEAHRGARRRLAAPCPSKEKADRLGAPPAEDCRAYDTILQEVAEQQIEISLSDEAENNYPKFGDALADL